MTKTKIMIGCSIFCLITAGALLVGILSDIKGNSELFNPLLAALILFIISWIFLYVIYLYRKNN